MKGEQKMTLVELQKVLGERIEIVNNDSLNPEEREREDAKSEMIVKIAKQMINNADVILRTEKLQADTGSTIAKVVGK